MKFHTYIKDTIMNNISHQSFQLFIRSWNFDEMILECSLLHYGMIMLMIIYLLGLKTFIEDLFGLSVFLII